MIADTRVGRAAWKCTRSGKEGELLTLVGHQLAAIRAWIDRVAVVVSSACPLTSCDVVSYLVVP